MHPRLLTTPWFTIHTFGVLLALAYLAALWYLVRGGRRAGIDPDTLMSLGWTAIIGAMIGAKALLVLRSLPDYLNAPSELFSASLLTSAGDFYGGFIGGVAASAWFFHRHREISFWKLADLCAPAIALGQAIGRLGCLMAGDDYGRPAHVPWAVTFRDPDAERIGGAPLGVPLHPVQVYESIACLGLFAFLVWFARRKRRDGDVILAYTVLYAIARFALEFFRGDADRGFVLNGLLSTSQAIAIVLLAISLVLFVGRRRAPDSAPAPATAGARRRAALSAPPRSKRR